MNHIEKYLKLMAWAWERYARNGKLVVEIKHQPTTYTKIENKAWRKYFA